jgi:hypothetical protein
VGVCHYPNDSFLYFKYYVTVTGVTPKKVLSTWNHKINGIKNKVKYDKSIKDKNLCNRKAFSLCLPKQCLA